MKEIPLRIYKSSCNYNPPASASAMVDDEDYEMLMAYTNIWYLDMRGYAVATKNQERMHRVIMGLKRGDPEIDHDDRNSLNNQKNNLLNSTRRLNCLNRSYSSNKSGYTGVLMHVNKTCVSWHVSHKQNDGVRIQVVYSCKHTAAYAYNKLMDISMGGCRGHRNDLSNSGFTIEELEQKLITDRSLRVGRRWKK